MTNTKIKSVWQRLLLFASSCCVFLLLVPSFGMVRYFLLYLMFVGVVLWRGPRLYAPSAWSKRDWAGVVLVSLMLVLLFSLHWSTFFLRLCGGSKATSHLLMMAIAVALAFGGSVFLSSVLRMMRESCPEASQVFVLRHGAKSPLWNSDVLISLLLAFLVVTVCSCFSPLYATNTWCSPACYHTVGKSLWSGLLPYRDLYEHKGPLIYALYSVATLVSYKSFFGMYLLSIPFAFFFFLFSRKTLKLLTDRAIDPWFIVVGAGIYCTTSYLCGGSVEELFLPFLAYALYVAIQYIVKTAAVDMKSSALDGNDGVSGLTRRQCFFLGLGMAVVFWTKFNIMAFYIALTVFLFVYTIHNHRFRDFRKAVMPVTIGFLTVTLPICLFYGFHGALDDLFRVYFHDNLFLYMEPGDMMWTQGTGHPTGYLFTILALNIRDNSMFFLAVLIASLWLRHRNASVMWLYLMTFVFTALFVFVKPDYFKYYCFILAAFVPFFVLPLAGIETRWLSGKWGAKVLAVVTLVAVGLIVAGSDNLWKTRLKKEDYIQFRFARTIMKEHRPTLLNYYCQDQGVFAVTGILPTNRFYCDFNNELPAVHEAHDSIVSNRRVQFVVTMYQMKFEGYDLVDQAMCPVKGVVFYLYKRKEL